MSSVAYFESCPTGVVCVLFRSSIDSQDIHAVAEHCPDIEQLDILGTSLVDQVAIRKWVKQKHTYKWFQQ
jgi:hypothetical protein